MNNRTVVYAKVHQDIFVPGLGGLGVTLPPQNKTLNLKMFWEDGALLLVANGREIIVPQGNIVLAVLGPKEETKST